ncbi:hypothetical protein [Streptomyces sp. NPDC001020]
MSWRPDAGRVGAQGPLRFAGLVRARCAVLGGGALQELSNLVGELEHQPFAGDEVG